MGLKTVVKKRILRISSAARHVACNSCGDRDSEHASFVINENVSLNFVACRDCLIELVMRLTSTLEGDSLSPWPPNPHGL
jgi:hypothetical protein